jgi:hypothetical protein
MAGAFECLGGGSVGFVGGDAAGGGGRRIRKSRLRQ